MQVAAKGASAMRFVMDVESANVANANSIRMNGVDPYRRRLVTIQGTPEGPQITSISEDQSPFRVSYEEGNPFADADGYVYYSNSSPIEAATNMMVAARAYELNIANLGIFKKVIQRTIDMGRA
jgi:flagellar basal-body rod protein FlgC